MKKRLNATTQMSWVPYIWTALLKLGGKARSTEVYAAVKSLKNGTFKPGDSRRLRTGDLRWKLNVRWARKKMISMHILKPGMPRGIWELTDDARTVRPIDNELLDIESSVSGVAPRTPLEYLMERIAKALEDGNDRLESILRDNDLKFSTLGGRENVQKKLFEE